MGYGICNMFVWKGGYLAGSILSYRSFEKKWYWTDVEYQPFPTYSAEPTRALGLIYLRAYLNTRSMIRVSFIKLIRYACWQQKYKQNSLPVQ